MTSAKPAAALEIPARPRVATDWTEAFTAGRLALLLSVLLLAMFPEVIFGTHSFFNNDFGLFTYPLAYYAHESLWRGELPLWNPLNNCGLPFLAQWNTTVCYPLSWFYFLFPLPWSLNYFCLGHLVLAGVFMYFLALRWTGNRFAASVAGVSYGFNGLTFNALMWTSILPALAWLPMVLLLAEGAWREGKRSIFYAAFAGAMQMFTGAPEVILMTWLLVGMLWLAQALTGKVPLAKSAWRLTALGMILCGLAAVQVLPFLELLRFSSRQAGVINGTWSMPAWGWANFIVPLFRCAPSVIGPYFQKTQQWTSSYYLGIGLVGLALVAVSQVRKPRVWWLAAAALLGMVLALGDNGLLYRVLKSFPIIAIARYPIKFVVPTLLAVPLLAAFGVAWLNYGSRQNDSSAGKSLMWSALLLLAALATILVVSRAFPYPEESWRVTFRNGMERALFLVLILGGAWLLRAATTVTKQRCLALCLLLGLALDAFTHAPPQNPTVINRAYGSSLLEMSERPRLGDSRAMIHPQMLAFLNHAANSNRFVYYMGSRCSLFEDCNLIDEIPKVNGFFPLYLRDATPVEALLCTTSDPPSGLLDFLGVTQISSPDVLLKWNSRETAMPWVSAGQTAIFAEPATTLAGLASAAFNPRQQVYLPTEARGKIAATNAAGVEIYSPRFTAHKVSFEVRASGPALVTLAQTGFPAWRAYVDQQPTRLWKANYAFQAIEVSQGRHKVSLVFRDWYFYSGAFISALTLAGCLLSMNRLRARALNHLP